MDSHLFRKAAWRLPALADLAVLRFNTRGTSSVRGTSEGAVRRWGGRAVRRGRALEYAEFQELPHIWLLGWSFGTDLALRYGIDPGVVGRDPALPAAALQLPTTTSPPGLSPAGRWWRWCPSSTTTCAHPEARERFAAMPQAEVVGVEGAKHLWVGDAETVLDEVVSRVAPGGIRCRRRGPDRSRPPTPARTPTGPWPPSPTYRCRRSASRCRSISATRTPVRAWRWC